VNRLEAGDQLGVGDRLISANRFATLELFPFGELQLYRTHFERVLWSSNTPGRPIDRVVMQADGNLVAYQPDGTAPWATGTDGHPGASATLRDDGDLVVSVGPTVLWHSGSGQDMATPTFASSDGRYRYVEVAEWLQDVASNLPCSLAMQWPGYATEIIEDRIDGQDVVIQVWKGWCPTFLNFMPGGMGAEVGVYRRIPGRPRPTEASVGDWLANASESVLSAIFGAVNLAAPTVNTILSRFQVPALKNLSDNDLWWPAPELNARLEMTVSNSRTGQPIFTGGPLTGYWLPKWMINDSYAQYRRDQPAGATVEILDTPEYWVDFRINGRSYPSWPLHPNPVYPAPPPAVHPFLDLLLGDGPRPPHLASPAHAALPFVDLLLGDDPSPGPDGPATAGSPALPFVDLLLAPDPPAPPPRPGRRIRRPH